MTRNTTNSSSDRRGPRKKGRHPEHQKPPFAGPRHQHGPRRHLANDITLAQRISQVIKDAKLPVEFDADVLKEAKLFGDKVNKEATKNRLDLTSLALCTIDGETAKDFDDAVFAQQKGKNIEVIVAIADVSYYVKMGSRLDEEALKRGTSVYYPGACIPMLPEELSNGLCSLKPNVVRLALSVSFEVGPKGGLFRPRFNQAVINSHARLTYGQVQDFYDKKTTPGLTIPTAVKNSLELLDQASQILRKARNRRGAIDFDIVESYVGLDDNGEPITIHPAARLGTHRMIEDLMVTTNEVVAEYFEDHDIPSLYRVHEAPNAEKLENFFKTAMAFGSLSGSSKTKAASITEPKDLQEVMSHYKNSKYEAMLNSLMLRAMMQARYSEKNLMHFGLASTAYSHFTSPIRRYADLAVHRQLRIVLFEKDHRNKIPESTMAHIAQAVSEKEVVATDTERKIDRLFAATFMMSHIGETFSGVVVSVTEFGLFVRITEHSVEGLVHISAIAKSRVIFMPEKLALVVSGSNIQYTVGDEVRVKLLNVNIDRGFIDFELDHQTQPTQAKKTMEPQRSRAERQPQNRRRQSRRPAK